ncbi:hypothetical protein Pmani_025836 [Petrolisthes manimaculis]|uniref:Uncharacterized protein n=1 Tax=Petrolisthes manimaculis TaxID=1843537 RepID=A0AAE1P5B2_9EUCA|nr:hypothetical protein Pmani_025836 [Petrolisthes manimaculis]
MPHIADNVNLLPHRVCLTSLTFINSSFLPYVTISSLLPHIALIAPSISLTSPHHNHCCSCNHIVVITGTTSQHLLLLEPHHNTCCCWNLITTPVVAGTTSQHLLLLEPHHNTCCCWNHITTPVVAGTTSQHLLLLEPHHNTCCCWNHITTPVVVNTSITNGGSWRRHIYTC